MEIEIDNDLIFISKKTQKLDINNTHSDKFQTIFINTDDDKYTNKQFKNSNINLNK